VDKRVLAAHYAIPLKRVVRTFEEKLPHLYVGRLALSTVLEPLLRAPLPQAALAVDAADLLL
jgi:hypothetical protein